MMRTTLTLDADVAAALERHRQQRNVPLNQAANDLLRAGLTVSERLPGQKRFRTRPLDLGECLLRDFDNVADVLATIESETFR